MNTFQNASLICSSKRVKYILENEKFKLLQTHAQKTERKFFSIKQEKQCVKQHLQNRSNDLPISNKFSKTIRYYIKHESELQKNSFNSYFHQRTKKVAHAMICSLKRVKYIFQ